MELFKRGKNVTPVPTPTEFVCRASVWASGTLTTDGIAVLEVDQFPGRTFVGVKAPEANRFLFRLPVNTVLGNGGTLTVNNVPGFVLFSSRCFVGADIKVEHADFSVGEADLTPVDVHFNPSGISKDDIGTIQGGMWTKMPFELRSHNQKGSFDIAATDFLWNYTDADRLRMVNFLVNDCHYTHAEVGPVVDSDGYHGRWQPNNWLERWDEWMDMHQYLWDHGLCPVSFIVPDNWSFERAEREITPYLLSERAQRLIRCAVVAWEPGADYSWSSKTWKLFTSWLRRCLPNAVILIHNAVKADGAAPDAPVGTDALWSDENNDPEHNGANNNGIGFSRVAEDIDGWLIQTGEWSGPVTHASKNSVALNQEEWGAMFRYDSVGAEHHSIAWHLKFGIMMFPRGSARGPNEMLWLYHGEGTAYDRFWGRGSQADANTFGDYAKQCGAKGSLDGCTLKTIVPVPWQVR